MKLRAYVNLYPAYGDAGYAASASLRLKLAAAHIGHLEVSIRSLEATNHRLRRELQAARRDQKDLEGELQEAQQDMEDIQERLGKAEDSALAARSEADRYRGWWLSEYHFVKVLLQMLSVCQRKEVELIAASSHARYYYHNSA